MKRYVKASTNSVSELAQFMKESVTHLLTSDATNNRYILDSDWAVYVGWSEGFDENDESVIHDDKYPEWAICTKIATIHEAVWADYDWCDMPYDEKTGEVWNTDTFISPEENYQETALWLLKEYDELMSQIDSGEFVPHKYN